MERLYRVLLAALEDKVEALVGKRTFKELYRIRTDAELKALLVEKAVEAEARWCQDYADRDLTALVGQDAALAGLPAVQDALRAWVEAPRTASLTQVIADQLRRVVPARFPAERLAEAAAAYVAYLVDALAFVDGLRDKLTLLAQRQTADASAQIAEGVASSAATLDAILAWLTTAPAARAQVTPPVLVVVHARGEDPLAQRVTAALGDAGYPATAAVLEEAVLAAVRVPLSARGLVVLCATQRALGNKWTARVLASQRLSSSSRIVALILDEDVEVEGAEVVLGSGADPQDAIAQLRDFVHAHYPLQAEAAAIQRGDDAERAYCEAVLADCDSVTLGGLPDRDLELEVTARALTLRRLYAPLHAWVRVRERASDSAPTADGDQDASAADAPPAEASERDEAPRRQRRPVGERLKSARRVIVLGDPGSGKTTLIRWLATAYLLRRRADPAWSVLPDVRSLPDAELLPVIVRLRDFRPGELPDTLEGLVRHAIRRTQLLDSEAVPLQTAVLARIQRGEALLLLDGLDEITDASTRIRFSQVLETIGRVYPQVYVLLTSRVVGYDEMGYRLERSFEALTLSDLTAEEKDDFVRRWCALTEPPARAALAAQDLIGDIHGSERIERLTGNPMLLTTMALIKRRVGRLPQHRVELYNRAVAVLLDWRREVGEPLEAREALPQLAYLAYAMCAQGLQRLTREAMLELLEEMRVAYPHLAPVHRHSPEAFLERVTARTGLLVEAGRVQRRGRSAEPEYEFRHLTFQEYLAARALVDGRYPGQRPDRSFDAVIGALAGQTQHAAEADPATGDLVVAEPWSEALRLCTAMLDDQAQVDRVLQAILAPAADESVAAARARAVQALLCVADEPYASPETVTAVCTAFAERTGAGAVADGSGRTQTSADRAVQIAAQSASADPLLAALLREFIARPEQTREVPGALAGLLFAAQAPEVVRFGEDPGGDRLQDALKAGTSEAVTAVALRLVVLCFHGRLRGAPSGDLIASLLAQLPAGGPAAHAAAWALGWLSGGDDFSNTRSGNWTPTEAERETLLRILDDPATSGSVWIYGLWIVIGEQVEDAAPILLRRGLTRPEKELRVRVAAALGALRSGEVLSALLPWLEDPDPDVRGVAVRVFGGRQLDEPVEPLLARLQDPDAVVRAAAVTALGEIASPRAEQPLLAALQDSNAEVRRAALGAVIHFTRDTVEAALQIARRDPEEDVRIEALQVWRQVRGRVAWDVMAECCADASPAVRAAAATALKRTEHASAELARLAEDSEPAVRLAVVNALPEHADDAAGLRLLSARLGDPERSVRLAAIARLGRLEAREALPQLAVLTRARDAQVREVAIEAVARIECPEAVALLIEALSDPVEQVRSSAMFGLGQQKATTAADRVIAALRDPIRGMRYSAVWTLGQLLAAAPAAAIEDALAATLKDPDDEVRRLAAQGLAAGGALALEALAGCASDPAASVQNAALDELRAFVERGWAEPATTALRAFLASDLPEIRLNALTALSQVAPVVAATEVAAIRSDPDAAVRAAAWTTWAALAVDPLHAPDGPALLQPCLADSDPQVRATGAELLGTLGGDRAVARLRACRADPASEVRQAAVAALAKLENDAATTEALADYLDDPDADVRLAVVGVLAERTIPEARFGDLMRDRDPRLRAAVLGAWQKQAGWQALEGLRAALRDPAPEVRLEAVRCLDSYWVEPVIVDLLQATTDLSGAVRAQAVATLGSHAEVRAVDALRACLADPLSAVRAAAVLALAALSPHSFQPELTAALQDPVARVRVTAAEILGAARHAPAADALAERLADPEVEVREQAAAALSALPLAAPPPAFLAACRHAWAEARAAAAMVLGAQRWETGIALLLTLVEDPARRVRLAAVDALATQLTRADAAVDLAAARGALRARLADPETRVVEAAVKALAALGDAAAVPDLARLLQNDLDRGLRRMTARALRQIGGAPAWEALAPLIESADETLRSAGVRAWASLPDEIAGPERWSRLAAAARDRDEDVRAAVAQALAALDDPRVWDIWGPLSRDAEPTVRAAVAEALRDVRDESSAAILAQLARDETDTVRGAVARVVHERGRASDLPVALALLSDPADHVQYWARLAVSQVNDASALPALSAGIREVDGAGREAIATAFSRLGATAELAALLRDPEPAVRVIAVRGLVDSQSPGVEATLSPLIRDLAADVRRELAQGLGRLKRVAAATHLEAFLVDADPVVRYWAVSGLDDLQPHHAIDAVAQCVTDSDPDVRAAVARALGKDPQPRWLDPLLTLLADPRDSVRDWAADGLRRLNDPRARAALLDHRADASPDVRTAVAQSLADISDPESRAALRMLLADPDPRVRFWALVGLEEDATAETLAALRARTEDPDADVRARLASAYGTLRAEAALPHLARLSQDPEARVRLNAIESLGQVGGPTAVAALEDCWRAAVVADEREAVLRALGQTQSTRACVVLAAALGAEREAERQGAAEALGALRQPDAIPALVAQLNDDTDAVRDTVLSALVAIGGPATEAALRAQLRASGARVRAAAAEALGRLQSRASVDDLGACLHDADGAVRVAAAAALGETLDERAFGALHAVRHSPDVALRAAVVQALGWLAAPEAQDDLIAALADPEPEVRVNAATALKRAGTAAALDPLRKVLHDPVVDVRVAAAAAVAAVAGAAALPDLTRLLTDEDVAVRKAGLEALCEMESPAAIAAMASASRDSDESVRLVATSALGEHAAGAAALCERLAADESADVRASAAFGLSHLRERDPQVGEDVLRSALSDPSEEVRLRALRALIADPQDRELVSWSVYYYDYPDQLVDGDMVMGATKAIGENDAQVRARYEGLARRFGVRLAWSNE